MFYKNDLMPVGEQPCQMAILGTDIDINEYKNLWYQYFDIW